MTLVEFDGTGGSDTAIGLFVEFVSQTLINGVHSGHDGVHCVQLVIHSTLEIGHFGLDSCHLSQQLAHVVFDDGETTVNARHVELGNLGGNLGLIGNTHSRVNNKTMKTDKKWYFYGAALALMAVVLAVNMEPIAYKLGMMKEQRDQIERQMHS